MKVTFTYQTVLTGTTTTPLVLGQGQRLGPLSPVGFSGSGAAQESHPLRAELKVFYGRGGGSHTETITCQKEHASYAAAMVWSRVDLGKARGKQGTLLYEFDGGGKIKLTNAVLESYTNAPGVVGIATFITFQFIGSLWQPA